MKYCKQVIYGIILGLLGGNAAYANPTGADIARGQVQFNHPDPSTLNITNSNGAIINWQQFSIQQNETTRFIQNSANSAVLNRITGQNPSDILGNLLSNGRVFLINPNGIVFGKDAVVDTAGLIASTLDMTDEDFIAGKLKFQGEGAADIQNMGYIKAGANGDIFLIAPNIENSGIIETEGGEIILAAGESLTIASLDSDHIVFDVQAPENEVVNLGKLITNGGAAKMFAGSIKHSGTVNADSIKVDEQGRVQIFASGDISIDDGAIITASGEQGGEIRIAAKGRLSIAEGAKLEATGSEGDGGFLAMAGAESIVVSADYSVRALGNEGENGWLYTGQNSEAARTIYNPNTAADIVGSGYGALPLSFEENQGQTADEVDFISRGSGYQLFLTPAEAIAALSQPGEGGESAALRLSLIDGNENPTALGEDRQEGISNYFIGDDPDSWVTDVANYGKVRYEEVYDGIDLVYYGNQQGELEYDFEVGAGVDPNQVLLNYTGADGASINEQGQLVFNTGSGEIIQKAPLTYQVTDDARVLVPSEYVLEQKTEAYGVSFNVDPYDTSKTLVIDPVLVYSTYLGGSGDEQTVGGFGGAHGNRLAVDASGNAYYTGTTASTDFPTLGAVQGSINGTTDIFVTKLNATGTALVYSTYLGGTGDDRGNGIAIDASGNAYLTGAASSGFPTTAGVFDTTFNGNSHDAFVTKLNTAGNGLVYSTYLGGTRIENGNALTVDGSGNVYLVGDTQGLSGFPTTAGAFQQADPGGGPSFVTKLDSTGSTLLYSTFVGGGTGGAFSRFHDIVIDGSGNAFVSGTLVGDTGFPTVNAFQASYGGGARDGVLFELNATGSALNYSTFIGGSDLDHGNGLALDSSGNIIVVGLTASSDFSTFNAFQGALSGTNDAYIVKIDPNQSGAASLLDATYFGGSGTDEIIDIGLAGNDHMYVVGFTGSSDLPTAGSLQAYAGGQDAFVSLFDANITPVFSTFIGGSNDERGNSIAVDSSGDVYIAGRTDSTDYPTTTGAFQTSAQGGEDQFITKIEGPDVYWNTNSSGNFSTASNWTIVATGANAVPSVADDALISRIGATPTITFASTHTVNSLFSDEAFTFVGGALTLNDISTLNSTFNWTGQGTISGNGTGVLNLAGTSTMSGNAFGNANRFLDNLTVNNTGTFNMVSSGDDKLLLNNGSVFNNQLGGVFNFPSDISISSTLGVGTFNNFGTLEKTAGVSGSSIGETGSGTVVFNSTASTVDAQTGPILLRDGGSINGSLTLSSNGLSLSGGTFSFVDGSVVSGGLLSMNTNTNIVGTLMIDDALVGGGTHSIGTSLTINNNFNWTGQATFAGGGTGALNLAGTSTMSGNAFGGFNRFLDNLTVNNTGTFNAVSSGDDSLILNNGSVFNNQVGGVFNFPSDIGIASTIGSGTFNNLGTLEKTAGAATSTIGSSGTVSYANTGGTVDIQTGTLRLGIGGNTLILDAASTLTGTGTFSGDVNNSGTIRPGTSPGILTINGNLTLNPSSVLDIELAGNGGVPGTDFDRIVVTGNASLDGTINAIGFGGFTPSGGDSFQVITCGGICNGTGGFATEIAPFGTLMTVNVNVSDVVLNSFLSNITNWTGGGIGDDWTTLGNWDNGVPTAGIDAFIDIGGGNPVDITGGAQFAKRIENAEDLTLSAGSLSLSNDSNSSGTFILSGGSLTGAGDLTITGILNWTGGSMTGTGTVIIDSAASMSVSSGSAKILDSGRTLTNLSSTSTWSGGAILLGAGSVLDNQGTLTATGNDTMNTTGAVGTATFLNSGSFVKTTGAGTSTITDTGSNNLVFNNTGTIDVQTGVLRFTNDGGLSNSSTIILANTTELDLDSGIHTLNAGSDVSGLGFLTLVSGSPVTLNVTAATNVDNFTLGATGSLAGSGTLTIDDQFNWTGGSMTGTGTVIIDSAASMSVSSGSAKILDSGRTLTNLSSTSTWSGGAILLGAGSVLDNQGTLTATSTDSMNTTGAVGTATVLNSGSFVKNTGTSTITDTGSTSLVFNNTGTIDVQAGVLRFTNDGGLSNSSTIILANTTELDLDSGIHTLNAGSDVSGLGFLTLVSGSPVTLNVTAATNVDNFTLGATGSLAGSGTLTIDDQFNWTGGSMTGTGTVIIDSAASMSVSSGSAKILDSGRTLTNLSSTSTWSGGAILLGAGSVLDNQGTLTATSTDSMNTTGAVGTATVLNSGSFVKNTGTSIITDTGSNNLVFNNTGTIDVQAGVLRFTNDGGLSNSSTIILANTTELDLDSGIHTLNAGSDVSGLGFLTLVSGSPVTLNVTAATNVDNFTLGATGSLAGSGTLTIDDQFNWTGGSMLGTGTVIIDSAASMSVSSGSAKILDSGRTLTNLSSTSTWSGGAILFGAGSVLDNQGTLTATGNDTMNTTGAVGTATVLNSGSFVKTTGAGTSTITDTGSTSLVFNNTGNIDVQTGTLQFNNNFTNQGTATIANGSILDLNGTTSINDTVGTITGSGTLDVAGTTFTNNGLLQPNGVGLFLTGDVTNDGTIDLNSTSLFITGSSSSSTVNGILTGTGILNMNAGANTFTSSGAIRPGTSPGITTITGNLTLNPSSIVVIELAGLGGTPGTDFDRIDVSGIATLDGTLDVLEFGGFNASAANTFDIMTYASSAGPGFQTITADFGDFYSVASISGDTVLRLTMDFNNQFLFWDAGGDAVSWDDPLNWSLNAVPLISEDVLVDPAGAITIIVDSSGNVARQLSMPGSSGLDDLTITSGGDLTLDGDSSIAGNFTISSNNSDLFGIGDLTVSGLTSFSGGGSTISGNAALFADGGFNINAGGGSTLTINRDIEIQSGGVWTDTFTSNINGTGTIINTLGSTISATNTSTFNLNVDFENLGTFTQTGSGDFNINGALINNNIINANAGETAINTNGTVGGTFNIGAGGTLAVSSGSTTFDSSSIISGATVTSNVFLQNANTTFDAGSTYNVMGNTTLDRSAGSPVTTINTNASLGSLTINTGNNISLAGTGDITVSGLTFWDVGGGQSIVGTGKLFANGGFNMDPFGGVTVTLDKTIEILEGGSWTGLTGTFNGIGKFVNKTGGTSSTITATNSGAYNINVEFENQGTFTQTGGIYSFNDTLSNNIFNINGGQANINPSVNGSGTVTGTFNIGVGATLAVTNGLTVFDSSSTVNGAGNVLIFDGSATFDAGSSYNVTGNTTINRSSGTPVLTFNTNADLGSLTFTTGNNKSLLGTGDVTVSGLSTFAGGGSVIGGSGTLFANGGFSLNGGGGTTLTLNRDVNVQNGGTWTDTFTSNITGSGTITNTLGSTITATNTGLFNVDVDFDNFGSFNKSSGGGVFSINGNGTHSGDFSVASGLTLRIANTQVFNSGSDTSGAGDMEFTGGTSTYNTGSTYAITGDTEINGGDVNFNITAATDSLTHVANTLGGSGSLTVSTTWTPTSGVTVDGNVILGNSINTSFGGTLNGTGTLTNQGSLLINGATINTTLDNDGGLLRLFTSSGAVSASVTTLLNHNSGSLRVESDAGLNGSTATLTVNGFASNDADILLDGGGGTGGTEATLVVSTGTFTNTGTITSSSDSGRTNFLDAPGIINNGTLQTTTAELEIVNVGHTFDTTTGTLDITAGSDINVDGGSTDLGSGTTFVSNGVLDLLNNSIVNLVSDLTIPTGQEILRITGATVNGPGNLINQGTLFVNGASINTTLDNDGGLLRLFTSSGAVSASVTTLLNHNSGSLRVESDAGLNGSTATLTVNGFASNDADILLDGGGGTGGTEATLVVSTGTFTNTGTITSSSDSGRTNFLDAPGIINNGTLQTTTAELEIVNAGHTFDTTTGTLDITAGSDINVDGGSTDLGSGTTFASNGVLDLLNSSIVNLVSDLTIPTGQEILRITGATVNGPGNLINQGTLFVNGASINTTLDNDGGLLRLFTSGGSISASVGTLLNRNSGSLRIESNTGTNGSTATLTVNSFASNDADILLDGGGGTGGTQATLVVSTGTFTNNGTITSTAISNRDNFIDADLVNAGIIDIDTGKILEITNTGSFTQQSGTITGNRLDINGGLVNWAGGTIENNTVNFLGGATLAITGNGIRVLDGPTLNINNANFTGGSLDVQSGTFNATGTTTVTADTTLDNSGGTLSLAALTVGSNSTLDMSNGVITASGLTTIDSGSTIDVSGGDFQPTTMTLDGLLTGSSNITLSGLLTWNDGQMSGAGTTFATGGIELDGFFANRSIDRDVEHTGTHTWSASGSIPGTGTLTHQGGTLTFDSQYFIDSPFVNNANVIVDVSGGLVGFDSVFNEGSFQINNGTFRIDQPSSSNAGTYTIAAGADLLIRNSYTMNGGNITGLGTLNLDGAGFDLVGGTVNPQTLSLVSASSLDLQGGNASILGVTTLSGGSDIDAQSGTFDASSGSVSVSGVASLAENGGSIFLGLVPIGSTGDLAITSGNVQSFQDVTIASGGALRLQGGTLTLSGGNFDNDGLVDIDSGTFDVSRSPSGNDTGTYDVASGATLDFSAGSRTLDTGGDITGSGTLDVGSSLFSTVPLGIGATGFLKLTGGTFTTTVAQVFNNPVDHSGGTLSNFSTVTVNNNYTWSGGALSFGSLIVNGDFTVTGVLTQSFAGISLAAGQNHSLAGATIGGGGGTLSNNGNLTLNNTTYPGIINNNNSLIISGNNTIGGNVLATGTVTFNSGSVLTAPLFQISSGGIAQGVGTVNGNVQVNGGTFMPGSSPGTFNILGNYTQFSTGVLQVELGGLVQGTSYDFLNITGAATLDGTLDIQMFGGFNGTVGDQFDIINSSSIAGNFASVNVPASYAFNASPNAPSVGVYQLEITTAPVVAPPPPPPPPPAPVVTPTPTPSTPGVPSAPAEETVGISTDQVIVLNEYQDGVVLAFAEPEEDEDEEGRELICR